MGKALIEDLDDNPCAVADCLDVGDLAASLTLVPPPEVGAVEDQLTADVWLCSYHAHLFRSGVSSVTFTPPTHA